MKLPELLQPLSQAVQAHSKQLQAAFREQMTSLTNERNLLEEQLDALYRWDGVAFIKAGGDRSEPARVTTQISETEQLVELLAECIEQTRLTMAEQPKPLNGLMQKLANNAQACILGKVGILKSMDTDGNANPQEVTTFKANLGAVCGHLDAMSKILGDIPSMKAIISELDSVTSGPATISEVA